MPSPSPTDATVAAGRFKVVIAFYQREPGLLARAVRSALEQPVEDLEVLVVDDESPVPATSELEELCSEDRERVRVLSRVNGGPAQARSTALEAIGDNADYVAFLDSDDAWTPDHLSRAGLAFERGYEVYFSNWIPLESEQDAYAFFKRRPPIGDELIPGSGQFAYAGDFLAQELTQPLARLSTLVYSWERFSEVRFEEDLRWASEDRLFRAQLATQNPRIALSLRPECTSGEGVNIFSGSAWGTEAFFHTAGDQVAALRTARRKLPLEVKHLNIVREALRDSRQDLAASWMHFSRRHPLRGLSWLGRLTARDPALCWCMPAGVLRALMQRGRAGS